MTLFLASAIPALAVAALSWIVAIWARSSAGKAAAEPIKDRYGAWENRAVFEPPSRP